ncbi:DUF4260 domain-containing protein [Sphingobium algorifonticola]|uniref:DUF4260 family protein n=1 Tax=Sphingobium algorifonticola TaxID=2008318 RepID=A0A437JDP5_9SPHN|nr:DUF4260 domain-containing protein [Sphingobium algorifonticola]RVT43810.1 DUF4260 family protein [Sphingobium algorifonticola]
MTNLAPIRHSADTEAPVHTYGDVRTGPKTILRLEGAVVLALASALYEQTGSGWTLFAAMFLIPDLSMLGYLVNRRVGASVYNLGHNCILPCLLGLYGVMASQPLFLSLALIWVAHVGFDRMVGYGLKYDTGFQHTHLGHGRPTSVSA